MEQDRNAFSIQRTKAPDLDDLQRTWEGMGRTLRSIERACAAVNESKELLIKLSRQLPSPSEHFPPIRRSKLRCIRLRTAAPLRRVFIPSLRDAVYFGSRHKRVPRSNRAGAVRQLRRVLAAAV